ncbi:MAG: hypothetical protein FJY73_03920 [Candidatus Eisenbacteria bacterium]|nr:hypothetical protein [Candidatus Eisenbacteria bacterium]
MSGSKPGLSTIWLTVVNSSHNRHDYTFETLTARDHRQGKQLIGQGVMVLIGGSLLSLLIGLPEGIAFCVLVGIGMIVWGRIKIWSPR